MGTLFIYNMYGASTCEDRGVVVVVARELSAMSATAEIDGILHISQVFLANNSYMGNHFNTRKALAQALFGAATAHHFVSLLITCKFNVDDN